MLLYGLGVDGLFVNGLACSLVSFVMSGMNDNEVVGVVEDRVFHHAGWSWVMEEFVQWVVWMG